MGNLNSNLLVFGGEINYNERIKMRECTYETILYNTEKKEWQTLIPKNTPQPRRNFACCLIASKFLMIYGGISSSGGYLNDVSVLNTGKSDFYSILKRL